MPFLLNNDPNLASKFLGVQDTKPAPQTPQQQIQPVQPAIPKPVQPYRAPSNVSTQQTPSKALGPSTGATPLPSATQTLANRDSTKQQGPLTQTPAQSAQKYTDQSKPAAATPNDLPQEATGERGRWSTDKDPTTGLVYDKTANNREQEAVAHTYVDPNDRKVHFTDRNPDGSAKAPWEDAAGWSALTEDQQKVAAQKYVDEAKADQEKQSAVGGKDNPLTKENWDQLDPAGKLQAAQAFLDGKQADVDKAAEAAKVPKTVVGPDGKVAVTGVDANGNPAAPWLDAAGWKSLTPEQQAAAKEDYAAQLEKQATEQQKTEDEGVAGTGIPQADWDAMTPKQQADALRGIKPPPAPVQNADGTFTTTDPNVPGNTTTKDAQGNLTKQTWADGRSIAYGANGAQTETSANGTITTTDNQGNVKKRYAPGSRAAELADVGFNEDGSQMPLWEHYAQVKGLNSSNPTPADWQKFTNAITKSNTDNWAKGEQYARAALETGYLTYPEYQAMLNAPYSKSFGAWLARNGDVVNAVDNGNVELAPPREATSAQSYGMQGYADADAYFAGMRKGQTYVDPSALVRPDASKPSNTPESKQLANPANGGLLK